MKNGEKEKAITLYEKIANTHAFLKKEIENDMIKLYLRFGDYQKAIELINKCKEGNKPDINLEYMLARANAGLNKPQEALKHLQNAESMGFNYGYVYINDDNFDPYRSTSDWQTINFKMNQYIETKMAASKKQP
ncbi:MAG: hypothetical protein IPJ13_24765 [Saprospiraceae bacterium]|nr:hypothetical protein [Saprospiraceae bacterium]